MILDSKLLTLIIPAYNASLTLDRALESIDYSYAKELEILIVDDGSKDTTKEVASKWVKRYPNTIKYFLKPNGNWGSVINYARNKVKGCWTKILDADDTYEKQHFGSYMKFLDSLKNKDIDLVISSYRFYYESINEYENHTLTGSKKNKVFITSYDELKANQVLSHHALTIRSSKFKMFLNLPTGICYTDTIYIYQCVLFSKNIIFLPSEFTLYEYHVSLRDQTISIDSFIKNDWQILIILKELLNIPVPNNMTKRKLNVVANLVKNFLYLNILVIAKNDKLYVWQKKLKMNKIMDLLMIYKSTDLYNIINRSLYFKMLKNFDRKLLIFLNKAIYSFVWWGFMAATKPSKKSKHASKRQK